MTHTFALLEVSAATWTEIAAKLARAGYDHALQHVDADDGKPRPAVDMQGIALVAAACPVECTSLADTAEAFIPSAIIGVDTTPWLCGRLKVVHAPSGEDFTDRVRWVNRQTGEAYVYLLDHNGRKRAALAGNREIAAHEIITGSWRIYVDGEELR